MPPLPEGQKDRRTGQPAGCSLLAWMLFLSFCVCVLSDHVCDLFRNGCCELSAEGIPFGIRNRAPWRRRKQTGKGASAERPRLRLSYLVEAGPPGDPVPREADGQPAPTPGGAVSSMGSSSLH